MISLGITTKEISEIFNCKESDVISIWKNINYSKNLDIEKEINIAIKVRDLLEKHFNFNEISHELKLSRYKLLRYIINTLKNTMTKLLILILLINSLILS